VHVGVGCGAPATERRRCETEAPRHQTPGLGNRRVRPTVDPHDPLVFRPPAPTPPVPQLHDPRSTVSPPNPRDRVPKNRWLPPVLPQATADHGHGAAPPSLPARWSALGARPKPRSSCMHPASVRELTGHIRRRSSARRLVKPISSESSEPTVPTLPPTRTAPRIHASSPSPNHAVDWFWSRRIGASSDPKVAHTNNKCSRSPSKRSHSKETLCPEPGHPRRGVATTQLHNVRKGPGLEVHRAGEPEQRATRPYERCSTRSCPARRDDVAITPRPQDAADPRTHGDQHRFACTYCMLQLPRLSADLSRHHETRPRHRAQRCQWPKPLTVPSLALRRHPDVSIRATRALQ
jgi:hypothetical protein